MHPATDLRQAATLLEATKPLPFGGVPHPAEVRALDQLGARLDSMIRTQMTAYPADWSDAERREMAELHLFGRRDVA